MAIRDFNSPMGLLQNNNNSTGSLGLDLSSIVEARAKQAEEDEEKRKRAEQSLKLQNFADTLRMVNANKSGNTQGVALYSERLANRRAQEAARLKKLADKKKRDDLYNSLNPNQKMIFDMKEAGMPDSYIKSQFYPDPSGNDGTSLMQNAQALAAKRKRYANMSEAEKISKDGVLLLQEINDFAGLGGALKYDAETEYEKNRAAESGKQGVSFGEGPLTTGQVATDKGFATFYKDYLSKGRGAKNVANVERLDDAKEIMKYAAKNGIPISSVPFSLVAQRPSLSAFFSPEGVMAQERVASVIQQSLKEILGGQFAEREGIALIQRGYNPALNPEENLERLLDLEAQVLQIVESEQDAVEYYENNNMSLRGYKGKRYTADDFIRDLRKDYTIDVIKLTDQDIEDAYMSAGEGSIWMETLTKEINRRADKKRK